MSGVRAELLDRQAAILGLPLIKVMIPPDCPNETYEQRMASTLASDELEGIDHVAFAVFLEDVRPYREERLARAGKRAVFPLWGRNTSELAREMVGAGFQAIVVCVDPRALDPSSQEGPLASISSQTSPTGSTPAERTASSTPSSGTPRVEPAEDAERFGRRFATIS